MQWVNVLRLFRPVNLVILILTQTTVYLTLPESGCFRFEIDGRFLALLLSTLCLAAAGYVINDYFDAKIDLINKPERTIVDTYIGRRYAIAWHILLNLVAVATGFALSFKLGVFNGGIAVALLLYSSTLKKYFFIGNFFVAALLGLVVFVVWLFDQGLHFELVMFYSFFAGLTGLLREIIKDVEDMEGDAQFGGETVPVRLGVYGTKQLLNAFTGVFLAFLGFFVVAAYFRINSLIAIYLLLAVALPTLHFLWVLQGADTKARFHQLSQELKFIMVGGLLSLFMVCTQGF